MRVNQLVARHEISNILAMHSRGVDRADAHLMSHAYHDHATVDYGFYQGPAAKLVEILSNAQKAALPSLHRTSNSEIYFKDNSALAESYVIAYVEDAQLQRMVFGRYLDRFEKHNGRWAMVHRSYVMDSNTNLPTTVVRSDPPIHHDHFVPTGGKAAADAGRALMASYEAACRSLQKAPAMTYAAHELDAAVSRDDIRKLLTRYCRAADRADAQLMQDVFWDDAVIISGICNGSPADFIPTVIDYISKNLEVCFHSIANEWI